MSALMGAVLALPLTWAGLTDYRFWPASSSKTVAVVTPNHVIDGTGSSASELIIPNHVIDGSSR